jgi:hypothetical protein
VVVDIAPWEDTESTRLFPWDELEDIQETEIQFSDQSFVVPPEDPAVPIEFLDGGLVAEVIEQMSNCQIDEAELFDGF